MKAVILAGGRGSRLGEITDTIPKPMVRIGDKPILWHVMSLYAKYGFTDFVIAGGYKIDVIREWISSRQDIPTGWKVMLANTGLETDTGGRIKRLGYLLNEPFFLTYGDGIADIDIRKLLVSYIASQDNPNVLVTVTAVHPPPRFGHLILERNVVKEFSEKPMEHEWINGGFFVCRPELLDRIEGDQTSLEKDVLPELAKEGKLAAYTHYSFWSCLDTPRDLDYLNKLYFDGCPWLNMVDGRSWY